VILGVVVANRSGESLHAIILPILTSRAHGRRFDSTLHRKQQFLLALSREPGRPAKLIPQDWMTDIPEKTDLSPGQECRTPQRVAPYGGVFFGSSPFALSIK
jgi:hypothetical protein